VLPSYSSAYGWFESRVWKKWRALPVWSWNVLMRPEVPFKKVATGVPVPPTAVPRLPYWSEWKSCSTLSLMRRMRMTGPVYDETHRLVLHIPMVVPLTMVCMNGFPLPFSWLARIVPDAGMPPSWQLEVSGLLMV
jgi:hypothetical protein